MTDFYRWRGGTEMLLRHGGGLPVTVLILPALFEEANRMRRFTVSMMRGLADAGIGSILPDLPGTGESLTDMADVALSDWHDAVGAVAETLGKPLLTIAIRGGALLDSGADAGWRLAPDTGQRLLRDMVRATALSSGLAPADLDRQARGQPTMLAGHTHSPDFYAAFADAVPVEGRYRTAQLHEAKLWRAAEPGDDPAFVAAVVADIASWAKTCAKS